jgi:tetratricopeptide (TPR) repeat protein
MIRRIVVVVAAAVAVNAASAQQRPQAKPPTLEQLQTRAREDSLDPEAHFRLAARYYTLKRFDDEERELRTTIEIDPRYAPAHRYVLAVLNQNWGRHAEAIRLLQEAIAADLGLYMGHVHLAQIYRAYKAWDHAIAEQQRAIETNPEDPSAVRELGILLSDAGQPAQAEEALGRAAATNPRDPRTIYHLGVVRQQLAKPLEARETLARFVAIAPAARYERELADARQRLAALGLDERRQ